MGGRVELLIVYFVITGYVLSNTAKCKTKISR